MKEIAKPYQKLLLVCVNERANGDESCGHKKSVRIVEKLKAYVNENGLKGSVRVSRTGCLGLCHLGPNVAVFPENHWYAGVTDEDADRIIQTELAGMKVASVT